MTIFRLSSHLKKKLKLSTNFLDKTILKEQNTSINILISCISADFVGSCHQSDNFSFN